jgi:uncharacterized protein
MARSEHGQLSWADLGAQDPEQAKRFYGELFGWSFRDVAMGAGGSRRYTFCRLGDDDVAGLFETCADFPNLPPHWTPYVTVSSVEGTVQKVTHTGGRVLLDPVTVMDLGEKAVVQDPSGAALAIWKPSKHVGCTVMSKPGTLVWAELRTPNIDQARRFYTQAMGWKSQTRQLASVGAYTVLTLDGSSDTRAAGMLPLTERSKTDSAHWFPYFAVTNCDTSTGIATKFGATTLVPPTDVATVGRYSVLRDPQGATFALLKSLN